MSLDDLADAVADDRYLQGVLHQGDGTVGVKGFKCAVFKKAVLGASNRVPCASTGDVDKENIGPPSQLVCPLSNVLMTNEPVIAADGNTYELAAIAEWFEKQQNMEVEATACSGPQLVAG